MAIRIRLRRVGAVKRPSYRLVVADSRSPRDGKFIESLGIYGPLTDPVTVKIDHKKVTAWLQKGARPSDTARDLLIDQGLLPKESARKRPTRPPRAAGAAEATREGT